MSINLSSKFTAKWSWMGRSGRHTVILEHDVLTGDRILTVDNKVTHHSGWRFQLVGTMCFTVDGEKVELTIASDAMGNLTYVVTVGGKDVPEDVGDLLSSPACASPGSAGSSTFRATDRGGQRHRIDFNVVTMDVFVDGQRADSVADFADDGGSVYTFSIGSGGAESKATLHVSTSGTKGKMSTTLDVDGTTATWGP